MSAVPKDVEIGILCMLDSIDVTSAIRLSRTCKLWYDVLSQNSRHSDLSETSKLLRFALRHRQAIDWIKLQKVLPVPFELIMYFHDDPLIRLSSPSVPEEYFIEHFLKLNSEELTKLRNTICWPRWITSMRFTEIEKSAFIEHELTSCFVFEKMKLTAPPDVYFDCEGAYRLPSTYINDWPIDSLIAEVKKLQPYLRFECYRQDLATILIYHKDATEELIRENIHSCPGTSLHMNKNLSYEFFAEFSDAVDMSALSAARRDIPLWFIEKYIDSCDVNWQKNLTREYVAKHPGIRPFSTTLTDCILPILEKDDPDDWYSFAAFCDPCHIWILENKLKEVCARNTFANNYQIYTCICDGVMENGGLPLEFIEKHSYEFHLRYFHNYVRRLHK